MKNGQLKVWWIPQVPMKAFEVLVDNINEAGLLLDTLADYDLFQFENKVKPDYCNAGGLMIWDDNMDPDENGEKWVDWYDDETGMEFDHYWESLKENRKNEIIKE